jgi:hypothetical protein
VAAGQARAREPESQQFRPLGGVPMLRTLLPFTRSAAISRPCWWFPIEEARRRISPSFR